MNAIEELVLPYLKLTFRKDLNILIGRWVSAVTAEQLFEGYIHTLAFARDKKINLWLMDMRLRNVSTQAEKEWFLKFFIPKASENSHTIHVAYMASPNQLAKFRELYHTDSPFYFSKQLVVNFFVKEQDAQEWLNTCRQRLLLG
ncbi:hypothetical protein [Pontibacter harenae]|uniref:hypothetical protein n=1 Tax=Pontibacter harenae TaxID=2894083 RepID=UPI001E322DA2|nr:hypothetical protein [Pontibacter harenae]MCC9168373.1 hypothetical protein [Pontibacter harenae]